VSLQALVGAKLATSLSQTGTSHSVGEQSAQIELQGDAMQRILLVLMTLALAIGIGCNQNRASNASNKDNAGADTTAASNDTANGTGGANAGATSAKLSDSEKQLLQKIADADKAEIEMGQLAQANASSPKVKDLGQKLVDDHTQNNQQLQQLAQQKGVELKSEEKPDEESMKSKFENMKGAQFDKAFLQHEHEDHTKLLKELKSQQDQIQDPDVKSFVSQTMTAVQQHHDAMQGTKATATPPSGE
jgi:putative membrane protein